MPHCTPHCSPPNVTATYFWPHPFLPFILLSPILTAHKVLHYRLRHCMTVHVFQHHPEIYLIGATQKESPLCPIPCLFLVLQHHLQRLLLIFSYTCNQSPSCSTPSIWRNVLTACLSFFFSMSITCYLFHRHFSDMPTYIDSS